MKLPHHSVPYEPSKVFYSAISYINKEISLRLSRDKKCRLFTDTTELSNPLSNNYLYGPKIIHIYLKDLTEKLNNKDLKC